MRRWLTLAAQLLFVAGATLGGDVAVFENLGFSRSGGVFVFGQYGVSGETGRPFAEMYIVDVEANHFVADGVFRHASEALASLGQDGRGALHTVLGRARPQLDRHRIDHLATGRPIYVLVDGSETHSRLSFRDFHANSHYDVRLTQQRRDRNGAVSAAFHLDITISRPGETARTMRVGRPSFYREGVMGYRITQILVGPDERSIVLVVERRSPDGTIRYMVETARI